MNASISRETFLGTDWAAYKWGRAFDAYFPDGTAEVSKEFADKMGAFANLEHCTHVLDKPATKLFRGMVQEAKRKYAAAESPLFEAHCKRMNERRYGESLQALIDDYVKELFVISEAYKSDLSDAWVQCFKQAGAE